MIAVLFSAVYSSIHHCLPDHIYYEYDTQLLRFWRAHLKKVHVALLHSRFTSEKNYSHTISFNFPISTFSSTQPSRDSLRSITYRHNTSDFEVRGTSGVIIIIREINVVILRQNNKVLSRRFNITHQNINQHQQDAFQLSHQLSCLPSLDACNSGCRWLDCILHHIHHGGLRPRSCLL
jgi:hypothetical protein